MKMDDKEIIRNIINYCQSIKNILDEFDYDYDVFVSNEIFQLSTSMCIVQIGEYVTRLSDDFKQEHSEIPWRTIKGMRNVATHQYDRIDFEIMWNTLTESVPELEEKLMLII